MASNPVAAVLKKIQDSLGKTEAMLMEGGSQSDVHAVIPTGIGVVDNYLLGIGGLPVGRLVEVYGGEGSGKTSFVLQCLAGVQKEGGIPILIETENAIDTERADLFGLDRSEAIIMQPSTCEEVQNAILRTLDSLTGKESTLLAWDSIAQTPLQNELDEGKAQPGQKAKMLSELCRVVVGAAAKKNVCLLFVNQIRDTIGNMFGPNITTPGGHAVKFAATVRLGFFGGQRVEKGSDEIGLAPIVKTTKNKLYPPGKKSRIRLLYEAGWDDQWTTVNHAKERKLIEKGARTSDKTYAKAVKALDQSGWK